MTPSSQALTLQALTPQAARLCLRIESFLTRDLGLAKSAGTPPRGLVLGYSGGADSKALLYIMLALKERLGVELVMAHLNHCLRPEAEGEEKAACRLAKDLGLPFFSRGIDVRALAGREKCGLEEAGRKARRAFLQEVRATSGASWILLGHQLDDLAEDRLMRMLRGAGWPALAGMRAIDRASRVLRPLLLTPRAELETFLLSRGVDWTQDASNADPSFLRNRVRARLLPLIMEENPSFLENTAALWRVAQLDAAWLEQECADLLAAARRNTAPDDMHGRGQTLFLPASLLKDLNPALRLRLYKKVLENMGEGQPLLPNLLALDQVWRNNRGGSRVQFPGGKLVRVRNGGLLFDRAQC